MPLAKRGSSTARPLTESSSGRAGGVEVDLRPRQPVLAPVGGAFEFHDLHPGPQKRDEGQEQLAVQPVLVEVFGRPVGGGDDQHAPFHQPLEQAADDHRVRNVGHLKLVEAEEPQIGQQRVGHGGERILHPLPARGMQARLHLLHEGMEMDAALGRRVGGGVEKVHQHGLSPPDAAPEVEAFRRLRLAGKAGKESLPAFARSLGPEAAGLEERQDGVLRRVRAQVAGGHARLVDLGQVLPHRRHLTGQRRGAEAVRSARRPRRG
jgi:hypothetical protein